MGGIKHLIECHCVLKIYKSNNNLINHKFPVYSKFDDNGKVIPKLVKCNNCESVHYVHDIFRSELKGGKDQTSITLTKDDIMLSLPERLSNVLVKLDCDISVWEHCLDIIEEERWNEFVVLRREIIDEQQQVKIIKIISENKFKIENKLINDTLLLR
tara:strand:+ start:37 stop:507 length:471 start_codon:yes stop_codon:yes gene_type:complete